MNDQTRRAIQRAAEAIASSEALLITAGAGMSVDSGLPDFRGPEGFWRAYPPLQKLGLSFADMAQPHWFDKNPELAWAFYGHRRQLYRQTSPHAGYQMLRRWGQLMSAGCFVVTSNVDGQFATAGFFVDQILEQHGNIHLDQCTKPCTNLPWFRCRIGWPAQSGATIDLNELRVLGPLPECPLCKAMLRPNVLMFNDSQWVSAARDWQANNYARWLGKTRGRKLAIIECGAGAAIATIRGIGEKVAQRSNATFVRINPDARPEDPSIISIALPALHALQAINDALPESFWDRAGYRPGAEPHAQGSPTKPGDFLLDKKYDQVYGEYCRFRTRQGHWFRVSKLNVEHLYEGQLEGLPTSDDCIRAMARLVDKARDTFPGRLEPVVLKPPLMDPNSYNAVIPPLAYTASIASSWCIDGDEDDDSGSLMTLIWFVEIGDERPVTELIKEALTQINWKACATRSWGP